MPWWAKTCSNFSFYLCVLHFVCQINNELSNIAVEPVDQVNSYQNATETRSHIISFKQHGKKIINDTCIIFSGFCYFYYYHISNKRDKEVYIILERKQISRLLLPVSVCCRSSISVTRLALQIPETRGSVCPRQSVWPGAGKSEARGE